MTTPLHDLLQSEIGDDLQTFLRARHTNTHIVGPQWLEEMVAGSEPTVRWLRSLSELGPAASRGDVIVAAEDAEQEIEMLNALGKPGDRKIRGLFTGVMPALLCGVDGMTDAQPIADLKRYAILCLPRSGSSYLSSVLTAGGLGSPKEHFRRPMAAAIAAGKCPYEDVFAVLESLDQLNYIFGTKLVADFLLVAFRNNYPALDRFIHWLTERGYFLRYLDRPIVEVVVSNLVAQAIGKWHFYGKVDEAGRAKLDAVAFDREVAAGGYIRLYAELVIIESLAIKYGLIEDALRYDDLVADPDAVVAAFSARLGIDRSRLKGGKTKTPVRTSTESETYARFTDEMNGLLKRRPRFFRDRIQATIGRLSGLEPDAAVSLVREWEDARGTSFR